MPSESINARTSEVADRFRVRESTSAQEAVLRLAGELDHDSAPALREALREAPRHCLGGHPGRILVDCADLDFCDSSGLNALLEARRGAEEQGTRIELVALSGGVARVFEITGAIALFPHHASLAAARSVGQ